MKKRAQALNDRKDETEIKANGAHIFGLDLPLMNKIQGPYETVQMSVVGGMQYLADIRNICKLKMAH
ncbi:hypothetical protein [Dyadobacter helix]|uniref:hypothetical protein n=1 Tax=Dyadobacter helix TaxID=2822344 RepID=UPI001BFC3649|nr:hypothetical protein [Dyadobacter sp. CECT 9275]